MLPEKKRTVKTIRHELENCDGDYEAVARRKQHNRRSDCVHTAEFLENPQKKVLEDPGIVIRALSCELNVSGSTMKTFVPTHISIADVTCSQKRPVKIV